MKERLFDQTVLSESLNVCRKSRPKPIYNAPILLLLVLVYVHETSSKHAEMKNPSITQLVAVSCTSCEFRRMVKIP
jgi:hypothetical protein